MHRAFVVIGGGPAGLTAALELSKHGLRPTVVEKARVVGGIARTEQYKGYHFDMGGHRFFTKSKAVERLWHEILEGDFLLRPRLSRIYYRKRFFDYPLKPLNALMGLGIVESVRILLSYARWKVVPHRREDVFEQWVANRFGKRLFEIFFKSYTEKVWGIPCSELSAEWAAQRIKNLSLKTALVNMFAKNNVKVTSLIDAFHYPRRGPGMLWNRAKEMIEARRGTVRLETEVVAIQRTGNRIDGVTVQWNGRRETLAGTDFISSMPITEFIKKLDPPPPGEVLHAADMLAYRDFLTVCLVIEKEDLFPDNWIYVHDSAVKVGRIQNFKNWSPEMVPDEAKTALGLEYFCNEGDQLWCTPDAELIELGRRELTEIGLADYDDVEDGCVFRVPKAYPVYDSGYRGHLETIKEYVAGLENFQTIGRNGLHRYNNQDHAMLTGMLAARNALNGEVNDLWNVNTDQEYHEAMHSEDHTTEREGAEVLEAAMAATFFKLDRRALGLAMGLTGAILVFLATIVLVLKGGDVVGPKLSLLNQYFPGYRVTALGSLIGLGYGFALGFTLGWTFALFRNCMVFFCRLAIRRRAEGVILKKLLEYV